MSWAVAGSSSTHRGATVCNEASRGVHKSDACLGLSWRVRCCGRMMAEEWATLSTTVQYGRRRPGWPLDHHVLDRPGKLWTLTDVPSLRIEPSSRHGRVLTHRLCCVHAGHGMGRPALLLWTSLTVQVFGRYCTWVCVLRSRSSQRGARTQRESAQARCVRQTRRRACSQGRVRYRVYVGWELGRGDPVLCGGLTKYWGC